MKRRAVRRYAWVMMFLFPVVVFPLAYSHAAVLHKEAEEKVYKLLQGYDKHSRFEASGVVVSGEFYYVVFDNLQSIAKLHKDLPVNDAVNRLITQAGEDSGFEGITYDAETGRFFVVVETASQGNGWASAIRIYDQEVNLIRQQSINHPFESDNKGFEGIAHIRLDGELYLLFLCEGNKCKSGKDGKEPGDGRIQVFHEQRGHWVHIDTIKLPKSVDFEDYSGLDIMGTTIAVTSQEDAQLWIGQLTSTGSRPDDLDFKIKGGGEIYPLPKQNDKKVYCNVEGVSFLDQTTLILVSDKKKGDQKDRCADQDQSVHIFSVRD